MEVFKLRFLTNYYMAGPGSLYSDGLGFDSPDQQNILSWRLVTAILSLTRAVARSDARLPDMHTVAGSILTSGKTFFR